MKKRRIYIVLVVICIIVQTFSISSVAVTPQGDVSSEKDISQETNNTRAYDDGPMLNNKRKFGLNYSNAIFAAYETLTISLCEEDIHMISIEEFVNEYSESDFDNLSDFCDWLEAELAGRSNSSNASGSASNEINISIEDELDASASSTPEHTYYYDIGPDLDASPIYSDYNILQLAQRGDVILDKKGGSGMTGHTAIVEGHCYSPMFDRYYVRIIEAVEPYVCYGFWDDTRSDDRNTFLYKVHAATPAQKDAAVSFCVAQLGEEWNLNLSHNYADATEEWICSQLVWAGYRNQEVNIEINGNGGGDVGVTPYDITVNSTMVTEVNFRCDLNTVPDGTYYITNYNSGLRLDIRGDVMANSTQVQQYSAGAYPVQKWRLTYNSNGRYYTIQSDVTTNGPFYLDVASPASGEHAKVKLWNECTYPEEKWFIQRNEANTYIFINGYSGLCMDIQNASALNNADVQVYRYVDTNDQKWMLSLCGERLFDDGVYHITNYNSGKRLGIREGYPGNSVQVEQSQPVPLNNQKWIFEWDDVWSCYHIKSYITTDGDFYLDVSESSLGPHAKVKLWHEFVFPEERWTIVNNQHSDTYRFINGYDGLCMDIQGASTESGADVQVYPYVGTNDQKWIIETTYG